MTEINSIQDSTPIPSIPILTTKLSIPRVRSNIVPRRRLSQRLSKTILNHIPLTLVSAPAGYGKTTMVIEGLNSLGQPYLWLSLDKNDNEPNRFFSYLITALQTVVNEIGYSISSLIGIGQLPPPETLMSYLVNELVNLTVPVTLVLDDYHQISNQYIHQAIQFLIGQQPPKFSLVIITREDPPFPLSNWRVRNLLYEFRADDLRFIGNEVGEFFGATMGVKLNSQQLSALESRTEGWVAGLQLAGLSMKGSKPEQAAEFIETFRGNHHFILDYLGSEVLHHLDPELKEFICRVAVLERFSASLCNAITGRNDSQTFLNELEQNNLFLIPLDGQREWYRFHHLFADFLSTELTRPTNLDIHRRAAEWLQENGYMEEAIRYNLMGEDWDKAAELILATADQSVLKGAIATLLGWVNSLPPTMVESRTELIVYKAWSLFITGKAPEAQDCAYMLEGQGLLEKLNPVNRGRLLSLQAWLAGFQGSLEIERLAREGLKLIPESDTLFTIITLVPLAKALLAKGAANEATRTYSKAYQIGRQTLGHSLPTITAAINLAFSLHEQGRRREAVSVCEEVLERYVDKHGRPLPIAEMAYIPLSSLYYESNKLSQAREYAFKAMDISRKLLAEQIMGGDAERTIALVQYASGETEAALETLREARQLTAEIGFSEVVKMYTRTEIELLLRRGETALGRQWAEFWKLTPEIRPEPRLIPTLCTYTRLLIAEERLQEAANLLVNLEKAVSDELQYWVMIVHILQAIVLSALGNENKALSHLKKSLILAAPERYSRIFIDTGPRLLGILPSVRKVAPDLVDEILAAVRNPVGEKVNNGLGSETLIEQLSERELEILSLVAEGRSNQEIAAQLFITVGTTKWHLNNIYGKLGAGSRTQAVAEARRLFLLP